MNNYSQIKLSKYANFLFKDSQVIALSRVNGDWIKFSKECYDILLEAISNNMNKIEIIDNFTDSKDKEYIRKFLDNLDKIGIIVDENEKKNENINKLESVDLMLTNRCNLRCTHCAIDSEYASSKEIFNTKEIFNIIDKIIKCNPKKIILTGGEPLLRDDFIDIIKHIKENSDVEITIMTNGTLINENNASTIAKLVKSVDISLDGVDENTCSIIRGKGVFEKVINAIRLLQKYGCNEISLSMVETKNNSPYVDKFNDLCKKLNVKPLLRELNYSGRAKNNRHLLDYISSNNQENVATDSHNQENEVLNKRKVRETLIANCCSAGINKISIEADGKIIPCSVFSELNKFCNNINDIEDLNEYLNSSEFWESDGYKEFKKYDPDINKLCKDCNLKLFCWTCPHRMYVVQENTEEFNKYCSTMKEYLDEILWKDKF